MTSIFENTPKGKRRIHFVGVGGSGIFPIVQIMLSQGYEISGSDNNPGDTIDQERAMGVKVTIGHSAQNVKGADAVIYSAAIHDDNVELRTARELGIPTYERSKVLGFITKSFPNCVCVSGTHGKTTTTSMITQIMLDAGLDPSAVIGGKLPSIHGSGRAGASETMVCEACEFVDTFLQLSPDVAVILNVDADHLEYFKTIENIIKSFHKFASYASRAVVANGDDANTQKALQGIDKRIVTFGAAESNDYYPKNIVWKDGVCCHFDLYGKGKFLTKLTLNVPGKHNVLNAVAACAASIEAGVKTELLAKGLASFTGVGRRFEVLGKSGGVTIADDYAHHPAELKVTLEAAKGLGFRKVWAVFQPFTYSRTSLLLDDFAKALPIADHVVMSAIMGARETNTYGITTEALAKKIPGSVWFETFPEIADFVMKSAEPGDLVITLGCGDVYKCAKLMLNFKQNA